MRSAIQNRPVARVVLVARGVDPREVREAVDPRDPGKSGLFLLPDDTDDRLPELGLLTQPLTDMARLGAGDLEVIPDEIPEELRMLAGGSNFLMGPEREGNDRFRPMGDGEEIHSAILDAHG
jgi:hypothetical protein